jgi:DNA-directed RNA polymerase specialized sigma24 family protein
MLFDRHSRTVYNYCFRRTADWSVAEDLTSVVFLETWRRRCQVRMQTGSLLPWLYGVATNLLHNHRRALRRHRERWGDCPHSRRHPTERKKTLPTDATATRTWLYRNGQGGNPPDVQAFRTVGDTLRESYVPPRSLSAAN